MPGFLPPGRTTFFVLDSGLPVAVLAVGPDGLDELEPPAVDASGLDEAPVLEGWGLMARTTMTVVDGPGELGFLVAGEWDELQSSVAWSHAVGTRGGAVVLFTRDPVVDLDQLPDPCAGGFVADVG